MLLKCIFFLTHNIIHYVGIIMSTPLPRFPVRAEEGVFSKQNCIHFLFVIEGKKSVLQK